MAVPRRIAARINGKNTHAEVRCAIIFADNHPAGYTLDCLTLKTLFWYLLILIKYFHLRESLVLVGGTKRISPVSDDSTMPGKNTPLRRAVRAKLIAPYSLTMRAFLT